MSRSDASARPVIEAILHRAADEVGSTLAGALADEPDGVHQHRVRVRRLRSVLGGFRDALDTHAAERLRVAFGEWGRELGVVRDIEVRATVAAETLERAGIDDPRVLRRLVESEREAYGAAHARLVELAGSPRAVERMRMLSGVAASGVAGDPDASAGELVAAVLRTQVRRVSRVEASLDDTDERYHDLRKAARRARYVAEAVADAAPGLFSTQVEAIADAGDELHDALGAHRDAMLLAHRARHEGVRAGRAGEPSDAYEAVASLARQDAAQHLTEVPTALKRLRAAASDLP
ncbi:MULTISPECIES: CHAD domain-containing protein [Microbacterium]|uniref:CHAD domain-containing protein n=1 Tax=Microbacterium TaxID=33882 RepID=UPI00146DAF32|nr:MULTISPECIES: CHAD domain-containing protein [Microbacterium]